MKQIRSQFILFFILFCVPFVKLSAQINPTGQLIATPYAGNLLQTIQTYYGNTGVVSNLTISCDTTNGQLGTYNWGTIDGLILTSGTAIGATGPNTSTGQTGFIPAHPGDPNLNALITPAITNDACVIEFDFVPTCNKFGVSFAFGSEEYPNFVGFYNDVCGIFLTGINPSGPNYNNTNIATIPGTTTTVCVNNMNAATNTPYFYDNQAGGLNAQYDGFSGVNTLPLDTVVTVFPGQNYHVKIAIADAGDNSLDSGMLFATGKDSCDLDSTIVIIHEAVGGGNILVEGCNPGEIIFQLPSPASQDVIYNVSLGGSATLGQDYISPMPTQITIPAGQNFISFPITTIGDTTTEGGETIVVFAEQVTNCFGVQAIYPIMSAMIVLNDAPTMQLPPIPPLCSGEVAMIGSASVPPFTNVLWTPSSNLSNPTIPNPNVQINNFTAQAQVYDYMMTLQTMEGCVLIDTVTVTVNPQPTLPMPPVAPTCSGSPVVLGAAMPGMTITWSPAIGLNNPNLDMPTLTLTNIGTTPQTYKYYRTSGSGNCISLDSVSVDIYPIPTLPMPTANPLCSGASLILGATNMYPNTQILWTPATGLDNPAIDMPTFSMQNLSQNPQTYTFIRDISNGVCSTSVPISVIVNPIPAADFQIPASKTCEMFLDLQVNNPSPTATYNWAWGDGNMNIGATASHTYLNTGIQNITLTATDFSNCTSTTTHSYEILVKPTADFIAASVCEKTDVVFTNTSNLGNSGNLQFEWIFDDGTANATTQNATHNYANAGTYNVQLSLTGQYAACNDAKTMALPIYPNPSPSFTATNVCKGEPMPFQNTSTSDILNPIVTYNWNFGDNSGIDTAQNPQHIYTVDGTYTVSLTAITDKGCAQTYTKIVSLYPTPATPQPINDTTCYGHDAILLVVANPSDKVEWFANLQATTPSHIGNLLSIQQPLNSVTYYVQTVSPQQCRSDKFPITLTMKEQIVADITPQNLVIELPNAIANLSVNSNEPIIAYNWGFGLNDSSALATPVHAYSHPGFYDVTVELTDRLGCKYLRSTVVEVKEVFGVFVPTAFSPNGDGVNDVLVLGTWEVANFSFAVYDRWGGEVFSSQATDFRWDGRDTKTGKDLPEGVYTYRVRATYGNGKKLEKGGTITILR